MLSGGLCSLLRPGRKSRTVVHCRGALELTWLQWGRGLRAMSRSSTTGSIQLSLHDNWEKSHFQMFLLLLKGCPIDHDPVFEFRICNLTRRKVKKIIKKKQLEWAILFCRYRKVLVQLLQSLTSGKTNQLLLPVKDLQMMCDFYL